MMLRLRRMVGPLELCLYLDWRAFGLGFRARRYPSWFVVAYLGPVLFTASRVLKLMPARGPHSH